MCCVGMLSDQRDHRSVTEVCVQKITQLVEEFQDLKSRLPKDFVDSTKPPGFL